MRLSKETSVCNDSDVYPRMNHLIQSLRSELGKRNKNNRLKEGDQYIEKKRGCLLNTTAAACTHSLVVPSVVSTCTKSGQQCPA